MTGCTALQDRSCELCSLLGRRKHSPPSEALYLVANLLTQKDDGEQQGEDGSFFRSSRQCPAMWWNGHGLQSDLTESINIAMLTVLLCHVPHGHTIDLRFEYEQQWNSYSEKYNSYTKWGRCSSS